MPPPSRIRQALNVESGLNDGLCVPLLRSCSPLPTSTPDGRPRPMQPNSCSRRSAGACSGGSCRRRRRRAGAPGARSRSIANAWIPVVPSTAALGSSRSRTRSAGAVSLPRSSAAWRTAARAAKPESIVLTEQIGNVLDTATFIVFGAVVLGGLWTRIGAVEVRLRVAQSDRHPNGARRDRNARDPRPFPTVAFLGWFGPRASRRSCSESLSSKARTSRTRRCSW